MAHRWEPILPEVTGLAHPVGLDTAGVRGPTRGQARGPSWRRTSRGRYVRATLGSDSPEQRIIEVAARMPATAAITGWAALRLAGATFHDGLAPDGTTSLPVPVAVGPRGGMHRDQHTYRAHVSFERLGDEDVVVLQGIRATHPVRATFDAVRAASTPHESVVALEMALIARLVTPEQVASYAAHRRRARRKQLVSLAVGRASPYSRSPAEVRLRLRCEEETPVGSLLVNPVLETIDGWRLGEVDLLDAEAGLVIEYDGADHRGSQQHSLDVLKDERLHGHAIEVLRVTSLQARSRTLPGRVMAARHRASAFDPSARTWRVRPRSPLSPLREPWLPSREREEPGPRRTEA